jgi:ArsR family metal-binding transcriptional regulator
MAVPVKGSVITQNRPFDIWMVIQTIPCLLFQIKIRRQHRINGNRPVPFICFALLPRTIDIPRKSEIVLLIVDIKNTLLKTGIFFDSLTERILLHPIYCNGCSTAGNQCK